MDVNSVTGVQSDEWSAIRHYSLVNKNVGEHDLKLGISTRPPSQRADKSRCHMMIDTEPFLARQLLIPPSPHPLRHPRSIDNLLFWLSFVLQYNRKYTITLVVKLREKKKVRVVG